MSINEKQKELGAVRSKDNSFISGGARSKDNSFISKNEKS